jgi:hypothetical protein
MRALGERTIGRRQLHDLVEDLLQPSAFLAPRLPSAARAFIVARSSAVKPPDSVVELFAGMLGLPSGVKAWHDAGHLGEG